MPRSDKGAKRTKYNASLDNTGRVGKENTLLNAFWKANKVSEFMTLSKEEADNKIDEWMAAFQERKIKKDKSWWYPSMAIPLKNAVNKRTNIDKGWHL